MDKNTLEAEQYMRALAQNALRAVHWATRGMESEDMNGNVIKELRIQGPNQTGGSFRVVVKATNADGKGIVAFGNGTDVLTCLTSLAHDAASKGLAYREDRPWVPPDGFSPSKRVMGKGRGKAGQE